MRKGLKKQRSIFQWILLVFTFFAVTCLLLAYAAYYLSPAGAFSYLAFFGLAYPFILLVNLIVMILWLILWKKFFWIPFIAIFLGFNHIRSLVQFDLNPESPASGSIKIMTFNVHSLMGMQSGKKDRTIKYKVPTFLKIEKPDILCFQEFRIKAIDTSAFIRNFKETVQLNYLYFQNYYDKQDKSWINALATFSRFPILNQGAIKFPENHVFAIYSDIIIDDEKIRIYNIHLESIRFAYDDYSFYSSLSEPDLDKYNFKEGLGKITEKLRKAFIRRAQQVDVLEKSISVSPYPVIVCGDFNDTPSSYTYNKLTDYLYDSFRKAGGEFLGSTYAGNFPSFRIDYILFDKSFMAYEYNKYSIDLSDHYPVSVYLNITPSSH